GAWVAIGPGTPGPVANMPRDRRRSRFHLDHPSPTWALGFAAGPYEVQSQTWTGAAGPLEIEWYRLPEHREAFDRMASITPALLEHHERIFGPYPFPDSRLAIVETLSSSSANTTWIGVGSRIFAHEGQDEGEEEGHSKAEHILAHELGHAWWGHGLSVASWRDNWLHESFASYGGLLFLGEQEGQEAMELAFQRMASDVSFKHRLALCSKASECSATSISSALWYKGPWVLRTLRSQIHNDEQWFAALRDFQKTHRFQTVTTDDLAQTLEKATGRSWDRFLQEWFASSGLPCIVGTVRIAADQLAVDLENRKDRVLTRNPKEEDRNFHLSLRLRWKEGGQFQERLLALKPGDNSFVFDCNGEPTDVELVGLESILGPHEVKILPMPHSGLGRR
ncbi:MAG: hypothetical protein KDB61_03960, partial [Planctomycetes bacterium]|nr:hypothetical protein [Planctomycetota bacterium]